MKAKKIEKKLLLNKDTIANLDTMEMKEVYGGISGSICGNPTCRLECG